MTKHVNSDETVELLSVLVSHTHFRTADEREHAESLLASVAGVEEGSNESPGKSDDVT